VHPGDKNQKGASHRKALKSTLPRQVKTALSQKDDSQKDDSDDGSAAANDAMADNVKKMNGKSYLIGDALKSVYQRTLEEKIPDDFTDLLKQLK
jgi:hypothetical protein